MREADPVRIVETIVGRLGGRRLLLLCDFDGTLVEFQPDPATVWLPAPRRALLERIAAHPRSTLGMVSGRRLADVRARTALSVEAYYAGLHGLEIEGGGDSFVHPQVAEARTLVHGLAATLARSIAGFPGAFLEDKELSLALHYRESAPERHEEIVAAFDLTTREPLESGRLRVMHGAYVLELLPAIPWNKGDAVRWIARHATERDGAAGVLPVYFGDDVTDEDAFREIKDTGVGVASSARVTGGDFRVDGPPGVEAVLRELAAALSAV